MVVISGSMSRTPTRGSRRDQSLDCGRQQPGRQEFGGSDPHFADRRVGEKLDVLDPLLKLVEYNMPALEKRVGVNRRGLDATRAAIEQADAQRQLGGVMASDTTDCDTAR